MAQLVEGWSHVHKVGGSNPAEEKLLLLFFLFLTSYIDYGGPNRPFIGAPDVHSNLDTHPILVMCWQIMLLFHMLNKYWLRFYVKYKALGFIALYLRQRLDKLETSLKKKAKFGHSATSKCTKIRDSTIWFLIFSLVQKLTKFHLLDIRLCIDIA